MARLRVVPIPAHSGFRAASVKIALLAWSTAARSSWSYVPCGMSSEVVKSGRIVRATALTAVRLATSPRRWPPMPSATIRSSRVRGSDRYAVWTSMRSEEHTSELQSHSDLVCRLLLEKKKGGHNQHTNALHHC